MANLDDVLAMVSSDAKLQRSTAKADLAQLIWSQKICENEILELLAHSDPNVRSTVAWAVADLNQPLAAVKWLMQDGVKDSDDRVRFWALLCASEMPEMSDVIAKEDVQCLIRDKSSGVKKIALDLWPDWNT